MCLHRQQAIPEAPAILIGEPHEAPTHLGVAPSVRATGGIEATDGTQHGLA